MFCRLGLMVTQLDSLIAMGCEDSGKAEATWQTFTDGSQGEYSYDNGQQEYMRFTSDLTSC